MVHVPHGLTDVVRLLPWLSCVYCLLYIPKTVRHFSPNPHVGKVRDPHGWKAHVLSYPEMAGLDNPQCVIGPFQRQIHGIPCNACSALHHRQACTPGGRPPPPPPLLPRVLQVELALPRHLGRSPPPATHPVARPGPSWSTWGSQIAQGTPGTNPTCPSSGSDHAVVRRAMGEDAWLGCGGPGSSRGMVQPWCWQLKYAFACITWPPCTYLTKPTPWARPQRTRKSGAYRKSA